MLAGADTTLVGVLTGAIACKMAAASQRQRQPSKPRASRNLQRATKQCRWCARDAWMVGWLFVAGWHPHLLGMGPIDMRKGVERSELWIASKVCRDLELRYHV